MCKYLRIGASHTFILHRLPVGHMFHRLVFRHIYTMKGVFYFNTRVCTQQWRYTRTYKKQQLDNQLIALLVLGRGIERRIPTKRPNYRLDELYLRFILTNNIFEVSIIEKNNQNFNITYLLSKT